MLIAGTVSSSPLRIEPCQRTGYHEGDPCWGRENGIPLVACSSDGTHRMVSHWASERRRLGEELERWEQFRSTQQRKHLPTLLQARGNIPESHGYDEQTMAVLIRVTDWQDYQTSQQEKVDHMKVWQEYCRQRLERLFEEEKATESDASKKAVQVQLEERLQALFTQQCRLEEDETVLRLIKQSTLAMFSEIETSMEDAPVRSRVE